MTRSQSEVLGLRAYPSVADLPEPADLAVILVPAAVVPRPWTNAANAASAPRS